jgi:hypothetical protein
MGAVHGRTGMLGRTDGDDTVKPEAVCATSGG